jgi:error-prone DNA polymerase
VRLGIGSVRTIGSDLAERIVAERQARGPYRSMEDLKRRVPLALDNLEALATAGAFACFERIPGEPLERREALWGAGAVAQSGDEHLAGIVTGVMAPALPGMSDRDTALADLWATGVAPEGHPTVFERDNLTEQGVVTADRLPEVPDGSRVAVAGVVTHRQRPSTAGGTTFLNLEDETGLINIIVSKGCWIRHRVVARSAPAMLIRGRLERSGAVVNIIAERLEHLPLAATMRSRDFR